MPDIPLNQYPLNTPIGRTKDGQEVFIDHRYHRFFFELIRRLGGPSNFVISDIAGLTLADGAFLVGDGTTVVPESGATARTSIGLGTTDTPQFTGVEVGHASDTTLARVSAGNLTVEGNVLYRAGGVDVALGDGGTGASLADPGADRILFWDESANQITFLEAGSNLTISGTTMTASGGGGGIDAGTSNPGSPSTGDLFFRTDLNLIITYDGTRWVTVNQYVIFFNRHAANSGLAISATTNTHSTAVIPNNLGDNFWVDSVHIACTVNSGGTALSGSHDWRFDFETDVEATGSVATVVQPTCFTDGVDAVSHFSRVEKAVGAALGTSKSLFYVDIVKIGTPGSLTVYSIMAVGRRIIS
jgi:hypothetical protein